MPFTEILDEVSLRFDASEVMKVWMSRGRGARPQFKLDVRKEEEKEESKHSDSESSDSDSYSDSDESLTDQIIKRQSQAAHIYTTRGEEKVTTRAVTKMLKLLLAPLDFPTAREREEGKFHDDSDDEEYEDDTGAPSSSGRSSTRLTRTFGRKIRRFLCPKREN